MTNQAPDSGLQCAGNNQSIRGLVQAIFEIEDTSLAANSAAEYLEHYKAEARRIQVAVFSGQLQTDALLLQPQERLILLVQTLKRSRSLRRAEVRQRVTTSFPGASDQGLNRMLDQALCALLMVNVRENCFKCLTLQTPVHQWDDASTLEAFVSGLFPPSMLDLTPKDARLDPHFTAANMVQICGLRILWTDSLEDHLRLDRKALVLRVFPYKACLLAYLVQVREGIDKYERSLQYARSGAADRLTEFRYLKRSW